MPDRFNFVLSSYDKLVTSKTDSNPHKKIKTSSQIRSIIEGTQVCVYIYLKNNQLFKGAYHRKMMQYGNLLSTKHLSETNISFENSY